MSVKRLQAAVFIGALLLAAWPGLVPAPKSDFDFSAFARLPVLEGGRVKPIDSFARSALLSIRSKQSVRFDGKTISATKWLLDSAFKPDYADTYPAFVVDDPEVLGLLGLPQGKSRYFPYWQIEPKRDEVQNQAAAADKIESGRRTRFQTALLNLNSRLTLYERIKNTFMVSGQGDPVMELAAFSALMPVAMRAFHSAKPTDKDIRTMKALSEMLQTYKFLAQAGAFKALPPREGAAADDWTNIGEALSDPMSAQTPHPGLASFALMGRAYRAGDAAAFNAALAEHAGWVARYRPEAARAARAETLFNDCAPFISGMALYLTALLLVFAAWAARREDVAAAARALAWAAFLVHTLGLLARTVLQGRPPVTNLYSSAVFVGWASALLGLVAERIHRKGFAVAGAAAIGFSTLLIAHHLSATGDTMEMMRAVLDSNFWLATHVVAITIGYSSTYLAGLLGIAWVVRRHIMVKPDPEASRALSSLAYGVIAFSLLFSFVGTVLGGIWADQSWGRFWGWDPKENGALLIVLWNALILHARWGGFVRERGIMLMAVFGNIIVSLSWFGVNMLGIGLHSYGFMDAAFWWLSAFTASQLALIALGYLPPRFWIEREAR
ncbi:MAG: cytochrome c biogenesis protein CcsA [Elusimicrobia bacterium]|nr:cytochrome c biogenesis protein CcsA [Elusimicrobiota bacterium]